MIGLRKTISRMGIKPTSAGPWCDGNPKGMLNEEGGVGGVGKCGHYDVELGSDGCCRDDECRRERLIKALEAGEAMMTPEGTILWTPGVKIRKDE
jgi:hypothetical protein